MFDKLLSELKRLEQGINIPVSLPLDEHGYFDRQCPSSECRTTFKVLFEDWQNKVAGKRAYCPICRFEAIATAWNTPQQTRYFNSMAQNHVQSIISSAMQDDAYRFNRTQNSGLISLSLSVTPGQPQLVIPVVVAEIMRQRFNCESCGCRYASVGLAYFCPACGHNSVLVTFEKTIDTVRQLVSSNFIQALESVMDKDVARDHSRNILEDSLMRLVGAFQYFVDYLFNQRPGATNIKQRKNVFQNLAESSNLWKTLTGQGYEELLSKQDFADLEQLFQKRHLIAHRNGIVDHEYVTKANDSSYAIGQRLVISEANVLRLAAIMQTLSTELRKLP